MPITKSAIKKLRVDKKRTESNTPIKTKAKTALKLARVNGDKASVAAAYSAMDKAVKHNLMNKKGVSRLKSRLAKAIKAKGKASPFGK